MANIAKWLEQIMAARFGRDVRRSIHDAIDAVNSSAEGSAAAAEKNAAAASASALNAQKSETAAGSSASAASAAANAAQESRTAAGSSASAASAAANAAQESRTAAENSAALAQSWAGGTDGEVREGDETDNSRYHCLQSQHYAELAQEYCKKIEQAGYKMCGDYDSEVTYDYPDVVFYDGSSYVAKKITVGNTPEKNSEYWQIFAAGLKGAIDYNDLINTPDLKSVATTGSYADLTDVPVLAKVATSGEYNDLAGTPTIPAVAKNGKLTIQRNGTAVQTFTANQGSDVTANILVPTISSSSAVTQTGQMALDAVEKNASIAGTLAHQIAQANSNLTQNTDGKFELPNGLKICWGSGT
ncbi:MAG: hypothetical protein K1W30_13900, partial [Lachnospiraceae bacterium]